MFIQLYRMIPGAGPNFPVPPARGIFRAHPFVIDSVMEFFWAFRVRADYDSDTAAFPLFEAINYGNFRPWHLIYAYMIENTRIYEIFEKIIFEYFYGEKLGFPARRPDTNMWLRTTEELFYKNSSSYLSKSIASNIRSDIRAARRNAYYRMFGMDLNHGAGGAASYPYYKSAQANQDFVALFEEFLREVWIGIENWTNATGTNPTDDAKMTDLIRRLREMLTTRRQFGNLRREEFFYVATMSWLHLTVLLNNHDVVLDAGVGAQSPAERLRQLGDRVGMPAHPKADAFFQMAEDVSTILDAIEHGTFGGVPINPQFFYAPLVLGGLLRPQSENVITQWSIATGRDLKARKVALVSGGLSRGYVTMPQGSLVSGGSSMTPVIAPLQSPRS